LPPPAPATPLEPADARLRQQIVGSIERRLQKGETVTLLGKAGRPRWYRWRTERSRHPLLGRPYVLSLDSHDRCLLELLPKVRCSAYHFEAQVQQVRSVSGCVGIFFLADERPFPGGMEQRFASFVFAAEGIQGPPKKGMVRVNLTHYREAGPAIGQEHAQLRIPFRPPATGPAGTWHTLGVTVRPDGFRAFWDGEEVLDAPRARWWPWVQKWWAGPSVGRPGSRPPPFESRGALGLYVEASQAEFRNVTIRPLRGEKPLPPGAAP
jgi:hypothetical protein